jgi:UTP--glucose-1-phosphate uridylyltransferase
MIKTLVIPAAGKGTRMLPITSVMPKEMLPVSGKPVAEIVIEEGIHGGIKKFIFIISDKKQMILDYFSSGSKISDFKNGCLKIIDNKKEFIYIIQDQQMGLGHAVSLAEPFIDEEFFAVALPDELIEDKNLGLKYMIDVHEKYKTNVLFGSHEKHEKLHLYGVMSLGEAINDEISYINGVVEKPKENAPSNYCIVGRYILSKDIFNKLKNQKAGVNGEIQITDAINNLIDGSNMIMIHPKTNRIDCGSHEGIAIANVRMMGL